MSDFSSNFRRAFLIHREISTFLAGAPAAAKVPLRPVLARLLRELPETPLPELTEAVRRAAAEVGREIDMDGMEYPPRDGGDARLSNGSRPVAALEDHANCMEGLAMDDRESRIRQRAYRLWEQDGWPTGMEAEHWTRAERELFSNGDVAFIAAGGEPVSEAATQSASAGKRPAVRSKSRAAKSPGATSSRGRAKPPK